MQRSVLRLKSEAGRMATPAQTLWTSYSWKLSGRKATTDLSLHLDLTIQDLLPIGRAYSEVSSERAWVVCKLKEKSSSKNPKNDQYWLGTLSWLQIQRAQQILGVWLHLLATEGICSSSLTSSGLKCSATRLTQRGNRWASQERHNLLCRCFSVSCVPVNALHA